MVTKGIVFSVKIASVFTALGCTYGLQGLMADVESAEKDCTNSGDPYIPNVATGRVKSGELSGNVWLEPGDASHVFMKTAADTPLSYFPLDCKLVFPESDGKILTCTWSAARHSVELTAADGGFVSMGFKNLPAGKVTWTVTDA